MKPRYFLVIMAAARAVAKKPRLGADEVAVAINIEFPSGWGTTIGTVDITAPDFHPEVRYEQVQDAQAPA